MYPRLIAVLSLLLLSATPLGSAFAHGDPPAAKSIYQVDDQWIFVTNFGVISSQWPDRYVCEEAFFGSQRFAVVPLGIEEWVTFTRSTVSTTGDGCNFERVHELPAAPTDVAINPASGEVAFTVQNDGVAEIWHSDDRGHSFSKLDEDLAGIRPSGIGFLHSQHLIVIAYRTEEERRGVPVLLEFDLQNGGRIEHEVDDDLRFPDLLDARNGNFLWHARRDTTSEIYWSRPDNLETGFFASSRWPTSGALSPDGNRAYLGGVDDDNRGVFSATIDDAHSWTEILPGHRALCMAAGEAGLMVCGHRNHDDHDLLFVHADDGFTELVDFRDLKGFRNDCPAESLTAQTCPAVWPETARALGIEVSDDPADGDSANDSDSDLDGEASEDPERGCHSTPANAPPIFTWLLLLAVFFAKRIADPLLRIANSRA